MEPEVMRVVMILVSLAALGSTLLMIGGFYLVVRGDYQLQQMPLGQAKRAPWWTLLPIRLMRGGVAVMYILYLCSIVRNETIPGTLPSQAAWSWEVYAGVLSLLLVGWVIVNLPAQKRFCMRKLHLSSLRPLHVAAFFLLCYNLFGGLLRASRPIHVPMPFSPEIMIAIMLALLPFNAIILWLGTYGYGKRGGWVAIATRLRLVRPSLLGLLYATAAGAAGFLIPMALHSEISEVPTVSLSALGAHQGGSSSLWILIVVAWMLGNVMHELLYRGLLQPRIGWIWASVAALPMMQLVFGGSAIALLPALPLSFAAGWLAKRYGPWASATMGVAFWLAVGIAGM